MWIKRIVAIGSLTVLAAFGQKITPGDGTRGRHLFEDQGCIQCHSIDGKGGTSAPDLGRLIDRNFTPDVLASLMWNHAPKMWSAMKQRGIARPVLSPQDAADLFAYFYSARFFDKPGDAGRGKQAFASHHCAGCHGITTSNAAGAPPVAKWESLGHPIILVQQMWNHVGKMKQAFAARKIPWQKLTSQELTDILVYLQNVPQTKHLAANFRFGELPDAQQLFDSKCARCHTGKLALENRLHEKTLTDVAVDMWNHASRMEPPPLTQDEMRQIVSYIWTRQFFRPVGSPERGKKVFTEKRCSSCHGVEGSGAPNLAKGKGAYSDITMIGALWGHGPQMLERMNARNIPWPRFDGKQLADLIAYLNSLQ